jgi:hypothetical protein
VKKSYTGQALTAYFNGSAKNGAAKSVLALTGTGELA